MKEKSWLDLTLSQLVDESLKKGVVPIFQFMDKPNTYWIKKEDKKPLEADGQIIVTNGNGFYEIIWHSDEEGQYKKPCAFDEYDRPTFWQGDFTLWTPIIPPINEPL